MLAAVSIARIASMSGRSVLQTSFLFLNIAMKDGYEVQTRVNVAEAKNKLQRSLLGVTHARLDLAFAIGIAHTTGHGDGTVMGQHIAIEGIQRRIVNIGDQHAFAEMIQNHHSRGPTESAKGAKHDAELRAKQTKGSYSHASRREGKPQPSGGDSREREVMKLLK